MTFLTEPVDVASPGVTYHGTPDVLVDSVCGCDRYGGNRLDCVDCAERDCPVEHLQSTSPTCLLS